MAEMRAPGPGGGGGGVVWKADVFQSYIVG